MREGERELRVKGHVVCEGSVLRLVCHAFTWYFFFLIVTTISYIENKS